MNIRFRFVPSLSLISFSIERRENANADEKQNVKENGTGDGHDITKRWHVYYAFVLWYNTQTHSNISQQSAPIGFPFDR